MAKEIKLNKLNKKLLDSLGVSIVLMFGSRVIGLTHKRSDVDIGVVFSDKTEKMSKPVEVYGKLYEELVKKYRMQNLDIVYLEESPLSLQYRAVADGLALYMKTPVYFADYKETVLKKYFDFKFFENIFNKSIANINTAL